ncbi:dynamin family protein [Breznakiellaceae bacterium SP9]
MAINPTMVVMAGQQALSGAKRTGMAVLGAGQTAHNWLEKTMPLDDPAKQWIGTEDFEPLKVPVSGNLDYKIKLLENTARSLKIPDVNALIQSIIRQINDDSFKVLFVGRYTTGKSTLLNKLMGRDLLKTAVGETTKTLAWLSYAEKSKEGAWYHDFQDDLHGIRPEDIADIPDEPPVFNVFASINAEILRHGAVLIDTPGLNASGDAAALTLEAVENADAVILVVDNYPPEQHDKELIEKLKNAGKTAKLFVVLNKMDKVPEDEQGSLIKSRIAMLSNMEVRTNVFPLSCKDESAVNNGFTAFRHALLEYIDTGLQSARETSVEQRIRNTAAYMRRICEEAAEISKIANAKEREELRQRADEAARNIEREVRRIISSNRSEINRLRQNVLNEWDTFLVTIKDDVNVKIQNATQAQLNQPNQLLGFIQTEINAFLTREFQKAEDQVRGAITHALDTVELPVPAQEGRMVINTFNPAWRNFKIPAEAGSLGLLAFTFFTRAHGFFSTLACLPNLYLIFVLSPFINKIFEQLLQTGAKIGDGFFKTKLQKEINNHWSELDENVRGKINDYFRALSDHIEQMGNETICAAAAPAKNRSILAGAADSGASSELENYRRQLNAIAGQE